MKKEIARLILTIFIAAPYASGLRDSLGTDILGGLLLTVVIFLVVGWCLSTITDYE